MSFSLMYSSIADTTISLPLASMHMTTNFANSASYVLGAAARAWSLAVSESAALGLCSKDKQVNDQTGTI